MLVNHNVVASLHHTLHTASVIQQLPDDESVLVLDPDGRPLRSFSLHALPLIGSVYTHIVPVGGSVVRLSKPAGFHLTQRPRHMTFERMVYPDIYVRTPQAEFTPNKEIDAILDRFLAHGHLVKSVDQIATNLQAEFISNQSALQMGAVDNDELSFSKFSISSFVSDTRGSNFNVKAVRSGDEDILRETLALNDEVRALEIMGHVREDDDSFFAATNSFSAFRYLIVTYDTNSYGHDGMRKVKYLKTLQERDAAIKKAEDKAKYNLGYTYMIGFAHFHNHSWGWNNLNVNIYLCVPDDVTPETVQSFVTVFDSLDLSKISDSDLQDANRSKEFIYKSDPQDGFVLANVNNSAFTIVAISNMLSAYIDATKLSQIPQFCWSEAYRRARKGAGDGNNRLYLSKDITWQEYTKDPRPTREEFRARLAELKAEEPIMKTPQSTKRFDAGDEVDWSNMHKFLGANGASGAFTYDMMAYVVTAATIPLFDIDLWINLHINEKEGRWKNTGSW